MCRPWWSSDAPDLVLGHNIGSWPVADHAQEHNRLLADSNSVARVGDWHNAQGCLQLNIPETCWIVDPMEYPFVDTIIDIAPTHFFPARRNSAIMVRSILNNSDKFSTAIWMGRTFRIHSRWLGNTTFFCAGKRRLAHSDRMRGMLVQCMPSGRGRVIWQSDNGGWVCCKH